MPKKTTKKAAAEVTETLETPKKAVKKSRSKKAAPVEAAPEVVETRPYAEYDRTPAASELTEAEASIGSYERMKRAFVARAQFTRTRNLTALLALAEECGHESTNGVRRAANKFARLSAEACLSCGNAWGKPWDVSNLDDTFWRLVPICQCMANLHDDEEHYMELATPAQLLGVLQGVNEKPGKAGEAALSRTCGAKKPDGTHCDTRFTLKAGSIAAGLRGLLEKLAEEDVTSGHEVRPAVERAAQYKLPRKCLACRERTRDVCGDDHASLPRKIRNAAPRRESTTEVATNLGDLITRAILGVAK